MPKLEPKDSSAEFVAIAVSAELEGLLRFIGIPREKAMFSAPDGSLLELPDGSLQVMQLTEAGCEWNEERGLMGKVPPEQDAALMDAVLVMFFAMYSREIGMPIMSDATIHELLDTAEHTQATMREWKESIGAV